MNKITLLFYYYYFQQQKNNIKFLVYIKLTEKNFKIEKFVKKFPNIIFNEECLILIIII